MLSVPELQNSCRHCPRPTLWFGIALPFPGMLLLRSGRFVGVGRAGRDHMPHGLGVLLPRLSTGHSQLGLGTLGTACALGKKINKQEQGLI